jgi:hypothetical protein
MMTFSTFLKESAPFLGATVGALAVIFGAIITGALQARSSCHQAEKIQGIKVIIPRTRRK